MIDSRFIPDVPSSDPPVTHRPEAHRFENLTDGHLSFATYQLDRSARQVVFDHTLVPPQLQGRRLLVGFAVPIDQRPDGVASVDVLAVAHQFVGEPTRLGTLAAIGAAAPE